MTGDFLVKARILVNEAELVSDELKSPVRPNVRKADLPSQHYLDGLRTSGETCSSGPGHDCGRLTGKPEVGFPRRLPKSA